jgi:hypothetical protein
MTKASPGNAADAIRSPADGALSQEIGGNDKRAKQRARQSHKIRQFTEALVEAGFDTLDTQSNVLRLARSTTWSILKGDHKGSGISATIVKRILNAPRLPSAARARITEYVEEKIAGLYGHTKSQCTQFASQLSGKNFNSGQRENSENREPAA